MKGGITMRFKTGTTLLFILMLGAVPLLTPDFAGAWEGGEEEQPPCDFLTGGGWILPPWDSGSVKANFAIGGGCKHGSPTWGHLNYLDHGTTIKPATAPTPFHVHWTSIEAYVFIEDLGPDPKTKQPRGTREVCGTATTNDPAHPVVNFRVRVTDNGEPGTRDTYWMHLSVGGAIFYDTGNNHLGGGGPGGGNIQLHKPNPSTTGSFNSCPYP
jgi:hypothetical protein